jgi:predicted kinase
MQKLIILRGAPASGKSTLAKSFRCFENKYVWLKVDNFKPFFGSDEALPYVNGAAIATLIYILEQKFSVVMEGVFQDAKAIDEARIIADTLSIPVKVFELDVSLDALKKRDLVREGVPEGMRPALGDEVIEKIYNNLKNNPYPTAIRLNTKVNTIEACKKIIEDSFLEK